jgi:hypothetical protein
MITTVILVLAIVVGVGWVVWRRQGGWRAQTGPLASESIPLETLAFDAFTHGNTCLAEGKFADAIASFQRARELDLKRLHVAERLAEAERRQQAESVALGTNAS